MSTGSFVPKSSMSQPLPSGSVTWIRAVFADGRA